MRLKYKNDNKIYEVSFKKISDNIVEIIGDFPTQTNGFTLSRDKYNDNWDYYSFTTIYKELDNGCQFSNDKSIYIEPEVIKPTEEELQVMFEIKKADKILDSKYLLAEYLESNPIESNCHGGAEAVYSVTSEKQSLMASNYLTYIIAKQSGLDAILTWNATGCECEVWTEEEFTALVLQISEYVKPLVALQQSYEAQIMKCDTQEELDAIVIDYDIYGKERL